MSEYGGDFRCRQSVSIFPNLISIPGGSNAFNFINFVAAVVTLVVNVNNNINNNNNNLNNVNVNTNNANNANANVNNNGVNSVVVMPGRWEILRFPWFFSRDSAFQFLNRRRRRDVSTSGGVSPPTGDQECGPGSGLGIVTRDLMSAAQVRQAS